MSRYPMKLFVSAAGSLALMVAAGCEERTGTTPTGDPATTPRSANEDVNALRPTPSMSAGGASSVSNTERLPVSGTEAEPMGGGKGGHAGHAGHGGSH